MEYPYLEYHLDENGLEVPSGPAEIPQHSEDCPGCHGDGYQIVVGPSTNFEFAPKACDGRPIP